MNYFELADFIVEHPEKATETLQRQYFEHRKEWEETPISEEDYVRFANRLASAPIDYEKVLGYIATTGKHLVYCKYNKKTDNFVVYFYHNDSPVVVTFFKRSWREFSGEKWTEYYDEIPSGK